MGYKKKTHKLAQNITHLVVSQNKASASFNIAQSVSDPISKVDFNAANALLTSKLDAVI